RVNRDGSEFEVLAHNFRNNYEVAIDSYGTLWQSDNDDDGNRSVRINYVMEYGNYGYTDERTGAGWRNRRINMEEEIHNRHWHQNDPGVVPNLLDTGAGSPTGILVYEGNLLPEIFHNEVIHTDAGPNVVRSYPVVAEGAGYHAEIENIMTGVHNQWFRPSDVTVAPDGSIFVADWYDPGVGGHQVRASEKGRIYRIAPENTPYHIPDVDYSTPESAVKALKSPNHAIRSKAWLQLHEWGSDAEEVLIDLWNSDESPRYQARALWLLSKLDENGDDYINQALENKNPDLRITAIRAARQRDMDIIPVLEQLVKDPSPQVRREVAIALRHNSSESSSRLWAELANQHDGEDRWYLEALGIGADRQWDRYFQAWLESRGEDWNDKAGRDLVWRARTDRALPMLAEIIRDSSVDIQDKPKYFRAFDFHSGSEKQRVLVSLMNGDHAGQQQISSWALHQIDPSALNSFQEVRQTLDQTLERVKGTYEFLDLVEHFGIQNRNQELTNLVLSYPDSSLGVNAARYMLESGGSEMLSELLNRDDPVKAERAMRALSPIGNEQSLSFLQSVITDNNRDFEIRRLAVEAFGSGSWSAEDWLLDMVRNGEIPPELETSAANVLMQAYRGSIRESAAEYLQIAESSGETEEFRPVSELIQHNGDIQNGRQVYQQLCQICHQVDGQGVNFGPELSEIGDKLPKEGLYNAILEPNAGINFGFEGYILTLEEGSQITGIIESETETELVLRVPGGMTNRYETAEIESRQQLEQSLMPDMRGSLSEQELIDLVEYLATLQN
ncbi:MAG: PVC-type heme-binding CxxCH protein, partial [Balneolaceae bacterium]